MELLTILNESRGEKPGKSDFLGAFVKHRVFDAIALSMLGFGGVFFGFIETRVKLQKEWAEAKTWNC